MTADPSVSADQRGVATGGDVTQSTIVTGDHNVVHITYHGATIRVPSPEAVQQHRVELRRRPDPFSRFRFVGYRLMVSPL